MLIWNICLIYCVSVGSHLHHYSVKCLIPKQLYLCRNNISFKSLFHIGVKNDFHELFKVFTITKLHTHNCNWPIIIFYKIYSSANSHNYLKSYQKAESSSIEQALACSVLITNNQTPSVSRCPSRYPTMYLTLGHSDITQFGAQPICKTLNRNVWVSKLRS